MGKLEDLIDERIGEYSNKQKLRLADLPLNELQLSLEQTWVPDGDTFLLPKSVGTGSFKDFRFGTANLTYGASATTSSSTAVLHGLSTTPNGVFAMTQNFAFAEGGPDIIGCSPAPTATTITFWGRRAVAVPAIGLTAPFFWVAFV